jgi:hypothetical protein
MPVKRVGVVDTGTLDEMEELTNIISVVIK